MMIGNRNIVDLLKEIVELMRHINDRMKAEEAWRKQMETYEEPDPDDYPRIDEFPFKVAYALTHPGLGEED